MKKTTGKKCSGRPENGIHIEGEMLRDKVSLIVWEATEISVGLNFWRRTD